MALETASAARVEEKRSQIAEEELRLQRALQVYLMEKDFLVSSRKSTPPQKRQVHNSFDNGQQKVDDFVGGVGFLKRTNEYIL